MTDKINYHDVAEIRKMTTEFLQRWDSMDEFGHHVTVIRIDALLRKALHLSPNDDILNKRWE